MGIEFCRPDYAIHNRQFADACLGRNEYRDTNPDAFFKKVIFYCGGQVFARIFDDEDNQLKLDKLCSLAIFYIYLPDSTRAECTSIAKNFILKTFNGKSPLNEFVNKVGEIRLIPIAQFLAEEKNTSVDQIDQSIVHDAISFLLCKPSSMLATNLFRYDPIRSLVQRGVAIMVQTRLPIKIIHSDLKPLFRSEFVRYAGQHAVISNSAEIKYWMEVFTDLCLVKGQIDLTDINDTSAKFLTAMFKTNCQFTHLRLDKVNLTVPIAKELAASIGGNSKLIKLEMESVNGGDSDEIVGCFAKAVQNKDTFRTLWIKSTTMKTSGMTAIAELLKSPSFISLAIYGCDIPNEDDQSFVISALEQW